MLAQPDWRAARAREALANADRWNRLAAADAGQAQPAAATCDADHGECEGGDSRATDQGHAVSSKHCVDLTPSRPTPPSPMVAPGMRASALHHRFGSPKAESRDQSATRQSQGSGYCRLRVDATITSIS